MSHGSSTIKVGFLGGGKMAKAIAAAIVRAGMCSASDINMSSRTEDSMKAIAALGYKAGTNTEARLCSLIQLIRLIGTVTERTHGGILFVTVKPAGALAVLEEVRNSLSCVAVLVSACVGVPLAELCNAAPGIPVARIMPNVLCAVGEGATGFCMNSCNEDAKALLLRVLKAFGPVHAISEDLFDAYSAISGSSPAFVCTFIEAMIDGGVKCGLPRQLATEAALQSVRGTAILAQTSGVHPALIRDDITSPGGTTIAGVLAMERRALRAAGRHPFQTARAFYPPYSEIPTLWD
ncbi:putative pyrroline-5-carboxylate reductase [Cyclospora cayetanensis]|uniref:Pyrroline-5-carboxylate reductase n=1 Tax=Cyclospora cayetanensis TaxID=88456 RepID=A0A1D3CTE4_9EIME|nr:putative pyrroline-5-carboxylate reductase [Cyclospora cayetanensis]